MTGLAITQILLVIGIVLLVAVPLGGYLHNIFSGGRSRLERLFAPCEKTIYKLTGINPSVEMDWKGYIKALLLVNAVMMAFAYLIFRLQGHLPLNPGHAPSMPRALAFNTAASLITNTDWQNYSGESSMSYLGQTMAVTYLQFAAAATGLTAAFAFVRGMIGSKSKTLGNFWVDFVKVHIRLLIPAAFALAVVLIALGVPQTFYGPEKVHTLQGAVQTISRGPIASLESIKQIGTNGGGFLKANSAHPFENPSVLTAVIEIVMFLSLPTAALFAFGEFLEKRRQAVILYVYLTGMLLLGAFIVYWSETAGNPLLHKLLGISGVNMEGKDLRFGLPLDSLFTAATTATSTGSVSAMHDSLTPLGGFIPLLFMMFNIIFGGAGTGLLNIIMYLLITVFIAGLMVGRTPEIFGKKIEVKEIKLAMIALLIQPFLVLIPTAIALVTKTGVSSMANPGLHGLSEVLYAFTSAAANNGSAFGGLAANTPFFNVTLGIVMLLGRYVTIIAMFAIAGSLGEKSTVPESSGTLRTDTYAFGGVFVAVALIIGALTFFPALALGPIGEHLQMWSGILSK